LIYNFIITAQNYLFFTIFAKILRQKHFYKMKKAYVFPGQGAQYCGMGRDLHESNEEARMMFESANEILGFRITDIMFDGTAEELKQTKVTQPAVFLHSVILAKVLGVEPAAVAGHSLGEFSALVVAGALSFEDGLRLVAKRAMAMQKACEMEQGTMAAVLALPDATIEAVCESVEGVVVAANYNCPGQLVISGAVEAVNEACAKMKEAGARRALPLPVGGAFHSPLMEPARRELAEAIENADFRTPICPIYQNVDAKPHTNPEEIKQNLVAQLTAPVRWTQIVENMSADGAVDFVELGPGKVLQGLISKISPDAVVESKATF
jgi:[acyl-carrier-protein] S-malonyltransferase